ncbi:MAG: NADPH:quinone oxidoreductase family protein [Hyphomonadaceae bacterium]
MKAILSKAPGGPETLVLDDAPDPVAKAGQVVVQIKAASVNFPDVLIIQDMYQYKPPRPFSPGGEAAGVIKSVGEGVKNVKVGDRVIASCGSGGFAEQVAIDADRVFPIPDSMPFDEASAFLMTYGTSYYALKDRAHGQVGQTLLVIGAAGGVGLAAVEIGKAMGMNVIAAASSQEKVDFAIAAGADKGLVYPAKLDRDGQKAFSDAIKEAGGGGVDIVYDGVGGDYAEPAVRALNWEGTFLVIGFPAGIPRVPLNLALLKSCQISGVFLGAYMARNPAGYGKIVAELMQLYVQGKVKPRISKRYPFKETPQAIRDLADRKAQGKIVVMID